MPILAKSKVLSAGSVPEPPVKPNNAAKSIVTSAAERHLENAKTETKMVPVDIFELIDPRDGLETVLTILLAKLTRTSIDLLSEAAGLSIPAYSQLRDINLRHGIKAAALAADVIKTIDNRRRDKSDKVTVGKVNVEAVGQAIVGNVKTGASPEAFKDRLIA